MRKLIAKIKYLSLILIELIVITQSTNIFARNVLKWSNVYNGGGGETAKGVAVDSSGNVYVTGQSFKLTTLDYCTIKYNTSGQGIWTNFYNGGGTDVAYGVAVDPIGNVYVTGQSFKLTTVYYCTIKYNSLGKGVWTNFYNDGSAAFAKGVAVDSSGNVYVTGSRSGVNNDYCTIKYNTTGQGIWTNFYDGGSTDYANGIAVDSAGNVYITGYSVRGGNSDYCTIKYNSSGQGIWTNLYNGGSDDIAYGVAVATNFNPDRVFVTGSIVNANNDYFTYGLPPARPGNFIGSGISTNSIAWTWQDKADDESGYALEDSSYNRIITRPANTTSCSETGFAPNQKWTRHICVTNAMGNVDSALNSAWTYALPPMNLVSTWTTVSSVGLQWQTNTGGCSWFMIQSSPTNTGGWTTFKSNFIVLSDTNTGLEAG